MVLMFEQLEKSARERNIPIMQKEGIFFLIDELKKRNVKSLLEIGSAVGYSSLMMASHVDGLKIETIERNEELYNEACLHVKEEGFGDQILLYHDDALLFDESRLQNAPYDVIFIDAAKAQYRKFFEKYVPYLKDDGIVIVDNLDFHGMIDHIDDISNRNTRALVRKIDRFRKWIHQNKDYHVDYYQVGDGLCIIKKVPHQLQLSVHLTHKEYLYDYLEMGIQTFIIAGDESTYSKVVYSLEEINEVAHKVDELYVMVNGLYDEHEIHRVFHHIDQLARMNVKGLLFQDFGVLRYVKKQRYTFDMMYAPMTLNTNGHTLNILQDQGVSSAWVAKEIPLEEQIKIKNTTHIPIMIQGHGVQYIMSSKRKLLSSYQNALGKDFDKEDVILHTRESDFPTHIYEDKRGTTIYSQTKLYTLDLFDALNVFDYLYIETNYMDPIEAIEVVHMYQDCLTQYHQYGSDVYVHHVKEYMPMLKAISKPLDRGFLNDNTLYRLEDVKRRDRNGAM